MMEAQPPPPPQSSAVLSTPSARFCCLTAHNSSLHLHSYAFPCTDSYGLFSAAILAVITLLFSPFLPLHVQHHLKTCDTSHTFSVLISFLLVLLISQPGMKEIGFAAWRNLLSPFDQIAST